MKLYIDVLLGLTLCLMLGANNLSACLGTSIGARALRHSQALTLASVGVIAGTVFEGYKLSAAITSRVVSSAGQQYTLDVALASFLIMAALTYRSLPISLSQVAVGAAIGSAAAQGIAVNWKFTSLVAASWMVTPLIGLVVAIALSQITRRMARRVRRVMTLNKLYAYLTIFSGIYASYALGANTVGLITGMVEAPVYQHFVISLGYAAATIVGMIFLSGGTTRSVAENIVGLSPSASFSAQIGGAVTVHGFTQFGVPVSVSQAVVGGVFGAAIPRKIVVRNDRLTREIMLGWTLAPLMGAGLAFFLSVIM